MLIKTEYNSDKRNWKHRKWHQTFRPLCKTSHWRTNS